MDRKDIALTIGGVLTAVALTIALLFGRANESAHVPKAFCEKGVLWVQYGSTKFYVETDDGCREIKDE